MAILTKGLICRKATGLRPFSVQRSVAQCFLGKSIGDRSGSRSVSAKASQFLSNKPQFSQIQFEAISKPATRTKPMLKDSKASYKTFADTLALRASPTLLYQAPSPTFYIVGCYLLGGFSFTWAAINLHNSYLYPAEGTPAWIPVFVGGIAILMVGFGTWCVLGTYRIVRTITALPPSSSSGSSSLMLRFDNASMFPGFRPKAVSVPYSNVILSAQLLHPEVKLTPADLAKVRHQQAKMREIERSKIMTLPFRQASYWLWRAFQTLKRVWSKEGFIYIRVKGKNGTWKLDRNAAWALDDGRALDRLVKHDILG